MAREGVPNLADAPRSEWSPVVAIQTMAELRFDARHAARAPVCTLDQGQWQRPSLVKDFLVSFRKMNMP